MKKILIINIFIIFFYNLAFASIKNNIVQNLKNIKKGQLSKLNIEVSKKYLKKNNKIGIF